MSNGYGESRTPIEPGSHDIAIDQNIGDVRFGCALGGLIIDEIPYSSQLAGRPYPPLMRDDILDIPELRRSVIPDDRNDRPGGDGRLPARERVNNESVLAYGPLAGRARRLNNTVSPVVEPSSYGDVQESLWWEFGGRLRRVTKALRLVVWYRVDGQWRREHILVGYEGAGGDS